MTDEMTRISVEPKLSTLELNRLDRALGRVVEMSVADKPASEVEHDLAGDVFHSLHRDPDARDEVPEGREINDSLLNWAKGLKSWDDTAAATHGNVASSLMAGNIMWSAMKRDEAVEEALKQQAEADEALQDAEAKELAAKAVGDNLGEETANMMTRDAHDARLKANELQAQAEDYVEGLTENDLSTATLSSMVKEAGDAADEVNSAMAGWGHGPGSEMRSDPSQSLEFLKRNSERLAKIAKLAGRMRGIGFEARRQRSVIGVEPTDIDYTRDTTRIFPSELALLSPNAPRGIREIQVAKFADVGLAGWEYTGSNEESGPFVCLIDESGSMNGEPEMVAKGIALGLGQVAKTEGRKYELIAFASDNDPVRELGSDQDWEAHLNWAEPFINGGTSFNRALGQAMFSLDGFDDSNAADLVFISDGIAHISDEVMSEWKAFAEEYGVRLIYVAVGHAAGDSQVAEIADQIVEIPYLDEDSGDELAAHLAGWMRP